MSDGINAMKSIDRKMMFNIIERDEGPYTAYRSGTVCEVGQLKNNLLSSIDDDSLNLATAVSEEILRIGLYSTDIAELGMDYLLANEISFEIR